MRCGEAGAHGAGEFEILLAGWKHPGVPAHGRHNVGLVECAGAGHDVAQRLGRDGTESTESFDRQVGLPTTPRREPLGRREVMERDDRIHASLAQTKALLSVVRQCGPRELAVSRFDPAPLH